MTRSLAAGPLLVLGSCLVVAAAESPELGQPCSSVNRPTMFDYVVLASIADSPYLLGMSGYNPARAQAAPE